MGGDDEELYLIGLDLKGKWYRVEIEEFDSSTCDHVSVSSQ